MNKVTSTALSLVFSLISSVAFGAQLQSFNCVTEYPSTSYFFSLQEGEYSLSVIHHNGIEHAPLYDGLVTIATIEYLQDSISNAQKIGDRVNFKFKPSDCIRLEKNRITCFVSGKSKLGPLVVESVYFNVYENSDSSTYGVFKDVRVSLDYRIGQKTFRMPMNFPTDNCSNRFN